MIFKINRFVIVFAFLALQVFSLAQKSELTCNEIVTKSLKSIKEIKGLKYHLNITERGKWSRCDEGAFKAYPLFEASHARW
jgi:hypothetical protein